MTQFKQLKWVGLVALLSMAAILMVGQPAFASVNGWLSYSHPMDAWNLGLASNRINYTEGVRANPVYSLDVKLCLALYLPVQEGFLRHGLGCVDAHGRGGAETMTKYISTSDFHDLNWLFNALLVVEVRWYSGSGEYTLAAWHR